MDGGDARRGRRGLPSALNSRGQGLCTEPLCADHDGEGRRTTVLRESAVSAWGAPGASAQGRECARAVIDSGVQGRKTGVHSSQGLERAELRRVRNPGPPPSCGWAEVHEAGWACPAQGKLPVYPAQQKLLVNHLRHSVNTQERSHLSINTRRCPEQRTL